MRKLVFALAIVFLSFGLLVGCSGEETTTTSTEVLNQIENGGFENGDLSGWTASGNSFQDFGVVEDDNIDSEEIGKVGMYYFNGLEAGTQSFTGTLQSSNFIVAGTGYISFLLGAAKDQDNSYVAVFDAETGDEIARQSATSFDENFITIQMIRYIVDLSEYMDQEVYLQIVDNDKENDFGYILCDDFVTYIADEATLNAYIEERDTKLDDLLPDPIEEDPTSTTIENPGFETGDLTGWLILSGKAFSEDSIESSSTTYWDNRDYLAIGEYFLDGYNSGETPIGEIRSTKFTLAGDGFISFLMGGPATSLSYVAICSEDGTELYKVTFNDTFKDPELALTMVRFYVDASDYIGDVLYIKVVDGQPRSPFGSISVDDFHVSMTEEEVLALMVSTYDSISALPYNTVNNYIKTYYKDYDYPFELPVLRFDQIIPAQAIHQSASVDLTEYLNEAIAIKPGTDSGDIVYAITSVTFGLKTSTIGFDEFDMSSTGVYTVKYSATVGNEVITGEFKIDVASSYEILNGGFENGSLAGWEVLTPLTLDVSLAVSDLSRDTINGGDMPFNKDGTYFFNGREGARLYDNESAAVSLRSSVFTLQGSGFISWRMAGRTAELAVYLEDGTQIAVFTNTAFLDLGQDIAGGSRLSLMTTFVADLSDYIGQDLYLEIHDVEGSDWGHVFFDDFQVYYEVAPDVENGLDIIQIHLKLSDGSYDSALTTYYLPWKEAVNELS